MLLRRTQRSSKRLRDLAHFLLFLVSYMSLAKCLSLNVKMWAFVILAPYRDSCDTLTLLKEIKLLNEGLTEPSGAVHWKTRQEYITHANEALSP